MSLNKVKMWANVFKNGLIFYFHIFHHHLPALELGRSSVTPDFLIQTSSSRFPAFSVSLPPRSSSQQHQWTIVSGAWSGRVVGSVSWRIWRNKTCSKNVLRRTPAVHQTQQLQAERPRLPGYRNYATNKYDGDKELSHFWNSGPSRGDDNRHTFGDQEENLLLEICKNMKWCENENMMMYI